MSLWNLLLKIERMCAAVGGATEPDLSKFPPTLEVTERVAVRHPSINRVKETDYAR